MPIPVDWQRKAREAETDNKQFFKQLKQRLPKNLDEQVKQLHDEVFEEIDCTTCANCCKTTSPLFLPKDIDRLAKHLRLKAGDFTQQYLRTDEDGDIVFRQTPCPFLGDDHLCLVYDARPNACREYPHTNQRKFHSLLGITLKNTLICPAVYRIVEQLKSIVGTKS